MKRIIALLVILSLLLSSGVISYQGKGKKEVKTIHLEISVPRLLGDMERCISTDLKGKEKVKIYYTFEAWKPRLPVIIKDIELPFSAEDIKVEVTVGSVNEMRVEKRIKVNIPAIVGKGLPSGYKILSRINGTYPKSWFKFSVRCGLNDENVIVKHVLVHLYPYRYCPDDKRLIYTDKFGLTVTYTLPIHKVKGFDEEYDMVIIAPKCFARELKRLVEHKNNIGVRAFLKTTDEIYKEFPGRDKPEKIKYFIKYAKEHYNITYVLLVGGLKSKIYAKPRDDANQGSEDWYVPVRYTNLYDVPPNISSDPTDYDPGTISDLYYADIYDGNGNFSSWDTNNDSIFAAWNKPGVENDTDIDLWPDVIVGRLACRDILEVMAVVNKIISYEREEDKDWFKKIVVVAGDDFLDQEDLDIQWNTSGLPDGIYTIKAQAFNSNGTAGEIDKVKVILDRDGESFITFHQDDHKKVKSYPSLPVAEITSPSNFDILGKTDVYFSLNVSGNDITGWADVIYENGTMHIKGKCYDPRPYGNLTSIHVWVEDRDGNVVFSAWRNNTEMYYESEWITGDKILDDRGGALCYMPEDFDKVKLWTSNGKFRKMRDVFNAINKGCGFVFLSGHGSPNAWVNHLPGVPGGRRRATVVGMEVLSLNPLNPFPLKRLRNFNKYPVIVINGCHNSQFNVSVIPALMHLPLYYLLKPIYRLLSIYNLTRDTKMWTFGVPLPECLSWYLVKLPYRGAIATIGNTGLSYSVVGDGCLLAYGGWISTEFFRQYGEEGREILGDAFVHSITRYIEVFDLYDHFNVKTIQEWTLLGDPSLKLG